MSESESRFVGDAFDLIDELERDAVDDLDRLRAVLDGFVSRCGLDSFTITRLPLTRGRLGPEMIVRKWPESWLAHYDRSDYFKDDPVGRHCFTTFEPFQWSDARPNPNRLVEARRVMSEAAEHGLAHGMCIPIHDITGFLAVVSLAGPRVETTVKMRKALHLVGIAAYGAAVRNERVQRKRDIRTLSPRERDVLSHMASGRTAQETAARLGLSETTIQTHLLNARVKMEASNTLHTVVQAYRHRQIQL